MGCNLGTHNESSMVWRAVLSLVGHHSPLARDGDSLGQFAAKQLASTACTFRVRSADAKRTAPIAMYLSSCGRYTTLEYLCGESIGYGTKLVGLRFATKLVCMFEA